MDKEIEVEKRRLWLTNLDKLFWPDLKLTKEDLINYYLSIGGEMVPFLANRPQSLHRFPNGVGGDSFYQKDLKNEPPAWADTVKIFSDSHGKEINYLICNNLATLIYMANLGCIEINPWNSSLKNLENPDYIVLDLDPEDISFSAVIETALASHEVLTRLLIPHFPKTSGATGLHIYIPLAAQYDYETAKNFAKMLAVLIHQQVPDITSLERLPRNRQKKVYVDYLQNNLGQTLAALFSVRPRPEATVSMPVTWKELEKGIKPTDFTIFNAASEIPSRRELFAPVLSEKINIETVLGKI